MRRVSCKILTSVKLRLKRREKDGGCRCRRVPREKRRLACSSSWRSRSADGSALQRPGRESGQQSGCMYCPADGWARGTSRALVGAVADCLSRRWTSNGRYKVAPGLGLASVWRSLRYEYLDSVASHWPARYEMPCTGSSSSLRTTLQAASPAHRPVLLLLPNIPLCLLAMTASCPHLQQFRAAELNSNREEGLLAFGAVSSYSSETSGTPWLLCIDRGNLHHFHNGEETQWAMEC